MKIQLYNKISNKGLILFSGEYEIGENIENPDGILVRSAKLHDIPLDGNLKAIARAGAGVNNVPGDKCSEKGIVVCTTGIGISITANKVKGVRCALCTNTELAKMTRLHNNSNMLALGASVVSEELAMEIVDSFLDTEFSNEERHIRRIDLIEK